MKRIALIITIIILIISATLTAVTFAYSNSNETTEKLPDNTTVNGIDCSGLTYEEAEKKLTDRWNSRHIKVTCTLDVRSDSFTDFGYKYDLKDSLKNVVDMSPLKAALNHYLNVPFRLNIPMKIVSGGEEFKKDVLDSHVFDIKCATESQDAYVDLSDPDFPIVEQVYGNEPDMDRVFNDLTESISNGDFFFVFDERKYLSVPNVTSNDPELLKYQQFCKEYLYQEITYELGEETFTIDAETLASLMKDDLSGKADSSAVEKYVETLAEKYDNVYSEREFTSLTGKDITVYPGIYGWIIDQDEETKRLISDINSHKNISREPVYRQTGYGEYCRDMGDTYIDVDISEQTVNYYKDGKLIFSSSCVTGNRMTGTVTDVGAYYVINKVRNVTLKGENADGSEYENFVSYWLGINWAGEGFHDATWRGSFGGSIWTYNGSHGCINMPPWRMPELYEKAEVGVPVAVHY